MMKNKFIINIKKNILGLTNAYIFLFILMFSYFSENYVVAQVAINDMIKVVSLSEVITSFDQFNEKEIYLDMRLKKTDYTFEKIAFYDTNNLDIIFDISGFEKNPIIKKDLINAHPGVSYKVVFVVTGINNDSQISGKLIRFTPLSLDKIISSESE